MTKSAENQIVRRWTRLGVQHVESTNGMYSISRIDNDTVGLWNENGEFIKSEKIDNSIGGNSNSAWKTLEKLIKSL